MAVMDKVSCNTYFLGVLPCDHLPKTSLRKLPAMVNQHTSFRTGWPSTQMRVV